MALLDVFDRIFIINRSIRTDRRRETRRMLSQAGWDPDGPTIKWFEAIDPKTAAGFINSSMRGCFLSHVGILNLARNMGTRRLLVLEDDCDFVADFADRQAEVARWLESNPWDIAYLGHIEPVSGAPGFVRQDPNAGVALTHSYAVSGEVLPRVAHCLELMLLRPNGSPQGGPMSPDAGLNWFRRDNPEVITVLASPPLAYQRPCQSDISPKWFDRVPGLSSLASSARAMRRASTHGN